jgi:glycosyltransferase involved in cell wall biosynthesis
MVRFPALSETFVAREIIALRERGWSIDITPLWFDRDVDVHPEVKPLLSLVRWAAPWSPAGLRRVARTIVRQPRDVAGAFSLIARQARRHPKRVAVSLGLFPIMLSIAEEVRERGVTHVHAHFAGHPALTALVINRLTGVPFSFTGHAHDLYVSPMLLPEKARAASFVVAISDYNRRLIESTAGRAARVEIVHCGVGIPEKLGERRPQMGEIVCVGRLDEKKGQRYLIDACQILHERGINVHCYVVGGGPDEPSLKAQAEREGLSGVITFTGAVTSDEVARRLREASVFVLPSVVTTSGNAEGIPVALMEAMAAGLPVISTTTTGIPELIEDGVSGLLVPPRDAAALADAIERLLADSVLCDRLREAAFQKVAAEFNLNTSADRMSALFESSGLGRSG